MAVAQLPSRRDEGWRWSDLRAAVNELGVPMESVPALGEGHIAERLHRGWAAVEPADERGFESVAITGPEVLIEKVDPEGGFKWQAYDLVLAPGADVTRIVHQRADDTAGSRRGLGVGVWFTRVHVKAGARFRQFVLAEGAKLSRIETHVTVEGDGAVVELNGAYLCGPGRHADLTSVIEHKVGNGVTRQLIKGVARKGGRGVFQGKIVVAPHAQKTDARQYHHGMLLEDGAEIFAKPELMIHADDVQCAHGNTAGGLDERALFYMRARGLPEAEARALLVESFLVEAIPQGLPEEVNEELVGRIRVWLAGGGA